MGTIVVSANVTLDGVGQDPTGEEGFPRGGWFTRLTEADRAAWTEVEHEEAVAAAALLLGRRSYEWFATRWAPRAGAWADRLRAMPKHVVATALADRPWPNTAVVTLAGVTALRSAVDGEIVVYGSRRLVRALLDRDLVDEVRLMLHPLLLGAGDRVFDRTPAARPMRLLDARTVGESLALLTYRRARTGT
jgi:dihydrofolate reductase